MSRFKALLDTCEACDGGGELLTTTQVYTGSPYTPDGIELDEYGTTCPACDGHGVTISAAQWAALHRAGQEHLQLQEARQAELAHQLKQGEAA